MIIKKIKIDFLKVVITQPGTTNNSQGGYLRTHQCAYSMVITKNNQVNWYWWYYSNNELDNQQGLIYTLLGPKI